MPGWSTEAPPSSGPADIPDKPEDVTFEEVGRENVGQGDQKVTFRITWSAPEGVATRFTVVGVKECDEYVAKYTRCADAQKDPTQREQFRESLSWTVQGWRDSLAQSGKATDVVAACKSASDAMKQAASSMGCTW